MKLLPGFFLLLLISCGQKNSKDKDARPSSDSIGTVADPGSKTGIKPATDSLLHTSSLADSVGSILKLGTGNEWVLVDDAMANWPKDKFDYFVAPKRKEIPDYPYIASGDFNGDGKQDAAALVNKPGSKTFAIAILNDITSSVPSISFWKEDIDIAAVSLYPKGGLDGINGEKIKMKGDGIGIEYYETSSFVLYWDGSAFKRVWTGD